jgi:uncharacterized membrane protein YeaQ/YmgE (transglycosylase-associated protein family)
MQKEKKQMTKYKKSRKYKSTLMNIVISMLVGIVLGTISGILAEQISRLMGLMMTNQNGHLKFGLDVARNVATTVGSFVSISLYRILQKKHK